MPHGVGGGGADRVAAGDSGARSGPWHSARGAKGNFSQVRPRRGRQSSKHQGHRHWPGDGGSHRQGPWRRSSSSERAWRRQHIHTLTSMSRILIVEDEADIALGLEDDLTMEGHEVEVARDGETASRRGREAPWDLILLDVMLPRKD